MDRSILMAINEHLKAALLLAERSELSLLSYLISVALYEVAEKLNKLPAEPLN